ncbi:MAG: DinB family protein [Gemmatimonadaceae bacterium]
MFAASCSARTRTTATRATRGATLALANLLAALVLLAAPALASAQSAADPVTGTWSGRIGPTAEPNYAVTLELRLDGTSVRGTMSTIDGSGEIRSGTYDRASGTLHVGIARAGEQSISLVLDGVAVQGMATGLVTRGQSTGTFVLTRKGASAGEPGANAGSIDRAQLRAAFAELTGNIAKAAELVPADRFAWRPVGTVRTVGQVVGHVADASLYYCGRAAGRPVQWSDAIAEGAIDKPALIAKLNDIVAQCSAAFDAGVVGPLIVNYGHASLHYGNLVTYLRLLGLVPPTSG